MLDFWIMKPENGLKPVQMGKYMLSLTVMLSEIMGTFLWDPADEGLKARHICSANQYVFM